MTKFYCLLLSLGAVCNFAIAAEKNTPTLDEIIAGIKKSESLLFDSSSFSIVCERVRCEDVTPSRYGGGYINVEFALAKKSNEWYSSKRFTQIGKTDEFGRNIIVAQDGSEIWCSLKPIITMIKNKALLEWEVENETIYVDKINTGRNVHQNLDYFHHIGWNASKFIMKSNGIELNQIESEKYLADFLNHPFLPDYLEKNKDKYRVLSNQENIDGFPCWVIEYPEMDKCWIDIKHGFALRKRIYHYDIGKPRKRELNSFDFREVKPGLWLPFKQTVMGYASVYGEDASIWNKVVSKSYYETREIDFTSKDDLFDPVPPVGTTVNDMIRETQYRVSNPNSDPFAGPIAQGIKVNRYVMIRAILIIVGSIMVFIAVWLKLRNRQV
ncbi:MAG: hypothetical protein LBJ67_06105 [Planctomycetaceae bacterium]|jgi:hypothetical protein|nr:hypothetical protein [Planctomycetaceae bacterium]